MILTDLPEWAEPRSLLCLLPHQPSAVSNIQLVVLGPIWQSQGSWVPGVCTVPCSCLLSTPLEQARPSSDISKSHSSIMSAVPCSSVPFATRLSKTRSSSQDLGYKYHNICRPGRKMFSAEDVNVPMLGEGPKPSSLLFGIGAPSGAETWLVFFPTARKYGAQLRSSLKPMNFRTSTILTVRG